MRAKLLTIITLLLSLPVIAASAQLPPGTIMTVGTASSHSVSLPLHEMTECPGATVSPMHPPIDNFEGIGLEEINYGDCRYPDFLASDDSGAVGPHHFVQVVNTSLAVYDKGGNRLVGPVSTVTFWSNQPDCAGRFTDSVVIYDRHADRWVISRIGGKDAESLCLAVSQTSDPAGAYNQYAFQVNNQDNGLEKLLNDYPKISAWPRSYLATANPDRIFTGRGNTISAFDRTAMLAGTSAPAFVTFFVPAPMPVNGVVAHTHMLPADLDGEKLPPADAPGYIAQVQDEHLGFPAGRLQLYEFHVDWTNPLATTLLPTTSLTPQFFNSNACVEQSCIEQPAGPALDSLSYGYMMYRLSYRNFGDHQTLLFNHTVAADGNPAANHAGIRWYELRSVSNSGWFIYQQGTYAPDANDRWLGSIAMDRQGNIALGFDVSGVSKFPSVHYVTRHYYDPPGLLLRGEVPIIRGQGAQLGSIFFGDYSQMTVDPADDCTFWYTNTYYARITTPDFWHTRIASFRFPDCGPARRDADHGKILFLPRGR